MDISEKYSLSKYNCFCKRLLFRGCSKVKYSNCIPFEKSFAPKQILFISWSIEYSKIIFRIPHKHRDQYVWNLHKKKNARYLIATVLDQNVQNYWIVSCCVLLLYSRIAIVGQLYIYKYSKSAIFFFYLYPVGYTAHAI